MDLVNKHHIIPSSRKDEWFNTSHPDNIIRIKVQVHNAIHTLFSNETPQEQLMTLAKINRKVYSPKTRKYIEKMFGFGAEDFYQDHLLWK